jgi:hypothetical protein
MRKWPWSTLTYYSHHLIRGNSKEANEEPLPENKKEQTPTLLEEATKLTTQPQYFRMSAQMLREVIWYYVLGQ